MTSFRVIARLKTLPNVVWMMASNREVNSSSQNKSFSWEQEWNADTKKETLHELKLLKGFLINRKKERHSNSSGRAASVYMQYVRGLCFWFASVVFVHIITRTLHVGSKIWILCSRDKNNISLPRFAHLWDIVFATRTQNSDLRARLINHNTVKFPPSPWGREVGGQGYNHAWDIFLGISCRIGENFFRLGSQFSKTALCLSRLLNVWSWSDP